MTATQVNRHLELTYEDTKHSDLECTMKTQAFSHDHLDMSASCFSNVLVDKAPQSCDKHDKKIKNRNRDLHNMSPFNKDITLH